MQAFAFAALQCLWGEPQTLLGALLALYYRKSPSFLYKGSLHTAWNRADGISLGFFTFSPFCSEKADRNCVKTEYREKITAGCREEGRKSEKNTPEIFSEEDFRLQRHEYGHSLQSLILGPFYIPFVGIPSFLWANMRCFCNLRRKKHVDYYSFYTERWADRLGGVL